MAPDAEMLETTLTAIRPVSPEKQAAAQARADQLAIPRGSLGRMLELSVRLAAIQGTLRPSFPRKAVIVMAGDHGVVRQGVSAFPAEVTPQMVANFAAGRAAINALADAAGARVIVVDAGVAADLSTLVAAGAILDRKVRPGTADISEGPAMTRDQALRSLAVGIEVVRAAHADGLDLVATGDMGIGNTTPSACVTCIFTGEPPAKVAGRGTGLDDRGLDHKIEVIGRALAVNRPHRADPVGVLAAVGGTEIGAIAGVMLGAASMGLPVLVDGFISTAGALLACALSPTARDYLIAAHRSREQGHRLALAHLGLQPLLDLDLRLGEGTGAALAMPLVDAAATLLGGMATFAEAGVTPGNDTPSRLGSALKGPA